ncbi:hypothetical protein [Mesorhizobium sp. B2-1-3A]|nr:hypothetical protein [Mesorhizobium sp. B2-1-3A]
MTALFVGTCRASSENGFHFFKGMLWRPRLPSLPSFAMPSAEQNP